MTAHKDAKTHDPQSAPQGGRQTTLTIGAHPVNRLHDLLPWNIAAPATHSVAA